MVDAVSAKIEQGARMVAVDLRLKTLTFVNHRLTDLVFFAGSYPSREAIEAGRRFFG